MLHDNPALASVSKWARRPQHAFATASRTVHACALHTHTRTLTQAKAWKKPKLQHCRNYSYLIIICLTAISLTIVVLISKIFLYNYLETLRTCWGIVTGKTSELLENKYKKVTEPWLELEPGLAIRRSRPRALPVQLSFNRFLIVIGESAFFFLRKVALYVAIWGRFTVTWHVGGLRNRHLRRSRSLLYRCTRAQFYLI